MNEEKKNQETLRNAAPYLTLGIQLAITVIVFFFIGKYADEYLGTTPWLMIAGALVGCVGGLYNFIKTVTDISNRNDSK